MTNQQIYINPNFYITLEPLTFDPHGPGPWSEQKKLDNQRSKRILFTSSATQYTRVTIYIEPNDLKIVIIL